MTTLKKMARARYAKWRERANRDGVLNFPPWDELTGEQQADFLVCERAALEAARVPTEAMGMAAYAAWDSFGEDAVMGPEEAIAIWQAMIDAILTLKVKS